MDRQSLLIYLVTAAIVGLGATALAGGGRLTESLYSPGPLHAKHADAACTTCHQPFQGVTGQGCLGGDCHSRAEIEKKSGKPFVVALHKEPNSGDCAACHPDHLGPAAKLTVAYHQGGADAAGLALRGEDCARCHAAEGREAHPDILDMKCAACHPSTKSWKEVSFDHRSAGVASRPCADCHEVPKKDFHARLNPAGAARCDNCHDTRRWKPARFDHQVVAREACSACHRLPQGALHRGLSDACEKCHSTRAWKPAEFDHGLLAAGARQACQNCHLNAGRRAHPGIRSTRCAACHTSTRDWSAVDFSHDQVAGEACTACHGRPRDWFHGELGGTSCADCHTTRRWEPSTFRHPRIPDMGEHMGEVGCRGCHPSSWRQARTCQSCHGRGGFFDD